MIRFVRGGTEHDSGTLYQKASSGIGKQVLNSVRRLANEPASTGCGKKSISDIQPLKAYVISRRDAACRVFEARASAVSTGGRFRKPGHRRFSMTREDSPSR